MNNKQDRAYARTAADLERKYNFGKTFAEVFGLIDGVKDDTEQAIKELDQALNHDEIFNRLTNYGKVQGIYRENDNIYINASYIKSGKLAADYIDADKLKVNATNITGSLTITQLPNDVAKVSQIPDTLRSLATEMGLQDEQGVTNIVGGLITTDYINALGISVSAAKITGKLSANQIDATNLKVSAANITGTLTAGELEGASIDLVGSYGHTVATFTLNDASSTDNRKLDITAPAVAIGTTSGDLYLYNVYGAALDFLGTRIYCSGDFRPNGDNKYNIGGSSHRWNNIYAVNDVIQTSDRHKKKNISYGLSKYDNFFDRLKPSSYQMETGKRTHTGLVAQDIESLLAECGIDTMDFAGFVKSEREDGTGYDYGLRYSEFIPLLIEQVQNLKARVHNIETGGSPNGRH